MSAIPTPTGTKIDSETERIIRERLAASDKEPKQEAREAIEEIRRELNNQYRVETPLS